MIDMGTVKGQHVFYTGGHSIRELLEAGELLCVPDGDWIAFKRAEVCTPIERQAALTMNEIDDFYAKHGGSK